MTDKKDDMGRIVTSRDGRVFRIGIDRPTKYNGFTPKMFDELGQAFTEYEADGEAWCALVYAEGDHFTAGLQLSEFDIGNTDLFEQSGVDPLDLYGGRRRTKPVVAAVKGICFTIGIELMLACDVVVAEEGTRFGQVEVKRGLMAFGGATVRFVERGGWGNAMRWLLTGDEFGPDEAMRMGFVQEITPKGQAEARGLEIAQSIARQAPLAVQATRTNSLTYLLEGQDAAVAAFRKSLAGIKDTEDFKEGVQSFIERREAVFKGK